MTSITQNPELINNLFEILERHRSIFKQERVYQRAVALALSELFVFGRHTITQQLMALGLTEEDWSAWYRLFSHNRFNADQASELVFAETLKQVAEDELYVVAVDGTQTPRCSRRIEGVSWLRNPRTPPFKIGIHPAQRWLNGSWLLPAENGYSRALPLRWLPAFTAKAKPQFHAPRKEWEAAADFVNWLQDQFAQHNRPAQSLLAVADGSFETVNLWKNLPKGVVWLARSAKNRVLYHLPPADGHGNRKYGARASNPQQLWQVRTGWKKLNLNVRGKVRHLQYRVEGPFLRQGIPDKPLLLLLVRGKRWQRSGKSKRRNPLPFLVNAVQDVVGNWGLPLSVETLLFWAWQRWEIEVCHREIKSGFGLGQKQCWQPQAAVLSVQWSAWVYSVCLLAGYRTWGLSQGPPVPTAWWSGAGRWSLNTLWRAFRATFWGDHHFRPLWLGINSNWGEKEAFLLSLRNAAYASLRS